MSSNPTSRVDHSEHVSFEDKPLRIFPVERVALEQIRPHEAVNQPDLDSFCRSFRGKGLFYKPILIDGESGTILDGTHRWAGLRELGGHEAPVIPFRYQEDDEIIVDTWYPFCSEDVGTLINLLEEIGSDYEPVSRDALDADDHPHPVLISPEKTYEIRHNPISLFHRLEETFDFQYTDEQIHLEQFVSEGACGFLRQAPSKQTVIEIAQRGDTVPPKYTCHRFPYKYPHIMARYEDLIPDEQ